MNNVIMLIYRSRNYDHRVATIIIYCLNYLIGERKWQVTLGKERHELKGRESKNVCFYV